jgi:hypothetical protein
MVQIIFVSDGIAFALAFIQTKDLCSHGGEGKKEGGDMNTHLLAILTIVVLGFGAWIVGQ